MTQTEARLQKNTIEMMTLDVGAPKRKPAILIFWDAVVGRTRRVHEVRNDLTSF